MKQQKKSSADLVARLGRQIEEVSKSDKKRTESRKVVTSSAEKTSQRQEAGNAQIIVDDALATKAVPEATLITEAARAAQERHQEAERQKSGRHLDIDLDRLADMGFVAPGASRNQTTEEFREIKRPLLYNISRRDRITGREHILLVTSARPGEGKTFTAINLAMSLAAEPHLRVVLIDGDPFKHDVGRILGVGKAEGFVDVLANKGSSLADVIHTTNVGNLEILPAGKARDDMPELLGTQRMKDVMDALSTPDQETVIVIDSPPILSTTETSALVDHAGQVIMVVEAGMTTKRQIEEALDLIRECNHVQLVLNKAENSHLADHYRYYAHYYGGESEQ